MYVRESDLPLITTLSCSMGERSRLIPKAFARVLHTRISLPRVRETLSYSREIGILRISGTLPVHVALENVRIFTDLRVHEFSDYETLKILEFKEHSRISLLESNAPLRPRRSDVAQNLARSADSSMRETLGSTKILWTLEWERFLRDGLGLLYFQVLRIFFSGYAKLTLVALKPIDRSFAPTPTLFSLFFNSLILKLLQKPCGDGKTFIRRNNHKSASDRSSSRACNISKKNSTWQVFI